MQNDEMEKEDLMILSEHSSLDNASHDNDESEQMHLRSEVGAASNMIDEASNPNSCTTIMMRSTSFNEVASESSETLGIDNSRECMGRENLIAMTPVSTSSKKIVPRSNVVKKSSTKRGSQKKNHFRRFNPKVKSSKKADSMESVSNFSIIDSDAQRVVNPLCDIPRVDGPSQTTEPPNANDAFVYTDLVFSKENTYPLSYHARLLGFQVNPTPNDTYVALDPNKISRIWDQPKIPPLGVTTNRMKEYNNSQMYLDPVYAALLEERWDFVDSLNKSAITSQNPQPSESCLNLARDILGRTYSEISIEDKEGQFRIFSKDLSLTYAFRWFQVKPEDSTRSQKSSKNHGHYGVKSLASRISKPKVAESILQITDFQRRSPQNRQNNTSMVSRETVDIQGDSQRDCEKLLNDMANLEGKDCETERNGIEDFEENTEEIDQSLLLVLAALCLEHARACNIFYGIIQVSNPLIVDLLTTHFRMDPPNKLGGSTSLICDLNKCTSKYAFLSYKESTRQDISSKDSSCYRMIIRFPTAQKVKMNIEGKETSKTAYRENISTFHSAFKLQRNLGFKLSIENDTIRTDNLNIIPNTPKISFKSNPNWNTLRIFKVEEGTTHKGSSRDEVLTLLEGKIASLFDLESTMDSKLRSLLRIVVDERLKYEKGHSLRQEQQRVLEEYNAVQERRREIDLAFQRQRDQDMDAVCEVCNDGEVTPENQILFCEACNVAVHQFCYGIERVPEGDYYCIACTFFGREQANIAITRQIERGANIRLTPTPLPINCELCPRKQGAFVRSDTTNHVPNNDGVIVTKWVHVLCAKWQGLNFVDNGKRDCVEDVQKLRYEFKTLGITCYLCEGDRGAYNKCRVPGCKKWMHVTCARAYGHCEVVHGENCFGEVKDNPWTLSCPEHSYVTPPLESVTREQLRLLAKSFPTESLTELKSKPVLKPFSKMISLERRDFLSEIENEKSLIDEIFKRKLNGVRCEVCHTVEEEGKYLTRCVCCGVVFCDSCKLPFDDEFLEAKQYKCQACKYVEEKKSMGLKVNTPRCILCFQPRGWLRVARGYPMKKWPLSKQKEYEKTLFGKKLWAHSICAMWQHPTLVTDITLKEVNLSDSIMTHGKGFILGIHRCELCGQKGGLKMKCSHPNCRQRGHRSKPSHAHVTCARQAGFEVDTGTKGGDVSFHIKCFRHVNCEFAFRARLEDMIELEKIRIGKNLEDSKFMSVSHASRLLNSAIVVMSYLGWAWRWAEWWVEYGSNWEPLLEPGQNEKKMSKEQLKIVDTTRESRCSDARRCRLSALGAALRNRSFDEEKDGPTIMLERALRAVLNTPSLVGPLPDSEIDIFIQWLGMAYRSKSRLLGFGVDKIAVDENAPSSLHEIDKTPKFILGSRPLPGKQVLSEGQTFESGISEVDDFLIPERLEDGIMYSDVLEAKSFKAIDSSKKSQKPNFSFSKSNISGFKRTQEEVYTSASIKQSETPKKYHSERQTSPDYSKLRNDESRKESLSSKRLRKLTKKGEYYHGEKGSESVLPCDVIGIKDSSLISQIEKTGVAGKIPRKSHIRATSLIEMREKEMSSDNRACYEKQESANLNRRHPKLSKILPGYSTLVPGKVEESQESPSVNRAKKISKRTERSVDGLRRHVPSSNGCVDNQQCIPRRGK